MDNKNEILSDTEIEAKLKQAEHEASAYSVKQASQETAIDQISAESLEIVPKDEDVIDCMNCSAALKGPYCHNCGQPDRHFIRFFPQVLWEMVNEAFDLDSKIGRTIIPLLFNPGRLSMEYIAGRRARYVNPLRLYIILSVLFFISITIYTSSPVNLEARTSDGVNFTLTKDGNLEIQESITEKRKALELLKKKKQDGVLVPDESIHSLEQEIKRLDEEKDDDESGLFTKEGTSKITVNGSIWDLEKNPLKFNGWFNEEITLELNNYIWTLAKKLDKAIKDDPSELFDEFLNVIPQLMFILLPMFALLLKFTYLFKKRYYMEHLIVALHSHCFIFLSLILIIALNAAEDFFSGPEWLNGTFDFLIAALAIWIPINIFITQKRVYAQGYFMTFVKYVFVGWAYWILLSLTAASAFIVGVAIL